MRKIPLRTCVVTRETFPKQELVRIVRTPEGKIIIDELGKANGRGAYLKKDIDVFKQAKKKKVLARHLETEIPEEIFEDDNCIEIPNKDDLNLGRNLVFEFVESVF